MVSAADTLPNQTGLNSTPSGNAVPNSAAPSSKEFDFSKPLGKQSEFWQVALPMLSARYIGRWISSIWKWDDATNPSIVRRAYGLIVATAMAGAVIFHNMRTVNDMKAMFGESVANELGKNKGDVTIWDISKSTNTIVQDAVHNVKRFNIRRFSFTVLPFLNFLLPFVAKKIDDPAVKFDISGSVDFGVGTTGAYLGGEIMMGRDSTLFENTTRFIKGLENTKLSGNQVSGAQIMECYMPYLYENKAGAKKSPEWEKAIHSFYPFAAQLADMINAAPMAGEAKKPIFIMNDLLGYGVVKLKPDEKTGQENLTYLEIGSRYGSAAIQDMAKGLKAGKSFEEVTQKYPVMGAGKNELSMEYDTPSKSHAAKLEGRNPIRPPAPSANHVENALKSSEFEYQRV
jgi:hypothetical protein